MASISIPEWLADVVTPVPERASATEVATARALVLDTAMIAIYDEAMARFEANIRANCPIILALFSDAGGDYTLYRPGEEPLVAPPVPVAYQVVKSVGHSSMAVHELVAPYLGDPANGLWQAPMAIYREQQQQVLDVVDDLDLPDAARNTVRNLLTANIGYLTSCLEAQTLDLEGLATFARGLKADIQAAIGFAAGTQVSHWMGVMDEWKTLLGSAWDKTYGVVNSIYVARTNNIMFTILAQYFGKDAFNDRLILLETTDFMTTNGEMLSALSRIVADRALGKIFFNDYFLMDFELLATGARDAVANEMSRRVPGSGDGYSVFSGHDKIVEEARARGLEPLMPPRAPFHSQEWPWRTHAEEGQGASSLAEAK